MKCINQNKKRLSSVSRSKKPAKTQKTYIVDSKKTENKSNDLINENKNESQPKLKIEESTEFKVSPQVIRTTFDSINVYLENSTVDKISQDVESANSPE